MLSPCPEIFFIINGRKLLSKNSLGQALILGGLGLVLAMTKSDLDSEVTRGKGLINSGVQVLKFVGTTLKSTLRANLKPIWTCILLPFAKRVISQFF
jgi:hypothetical protein